MEGFLAPMLSFQYRCFRQKNSWRQRQNSRCLRCYFCGSSSETLGIWPKMESRSLLISCHNSENSEVNFAAPAPRGMRGSSSGSMWTPSRPPKMRNGQLDCRVTPGTKCPGAAMTERLNRIHSNRIRGVAQMLPGALRYLLNQSSVRCQASLAAASS